MSGLLLAFGSAFFAELMRETFLTPRELEAFTGYPVVATIPLQKARTRQIDLSVSEPMDPKEIHMAEDLFSGDVAKNVPGHGFNWEYQND